jgi:hypothetical protein
VGAALNDCALHDECEVGRKSELLGSLDVPERELDDPATARYRKLRSKTTVVWSVEHQRKQVKLRH